ncbi:MAG: shikimate dehydrogenase [Paraprevotella sp.]|nr:shikimate dehydrogenase [Paraprevotella sp.]
MDLYGLIGHPLGHSFSKKFFNEKFQNEMIDAEYRNFDIDTIKSFPTIIEEYSNLRGLNVTIPYKELIIPYLDELSEDAQAIGAVNVIKISRNHEGVHLKGYNSDVIGFTDSIRPLLKPFHKKALILGTGGASKAIRYGLYKLGIETCFVSRRPKEGMLTYSDLTADIMAEYTVIVNCSPVGMFPHTDERPDLPYQFIGSHHILYDLVYNPDETLFMKSGKEQGATTKNGLEMLILQARAGWNFWNE